MGGSRKRHSPWWMDEVRKAGRYKTKQRIWLRRLTPDTILKYVVLRREIKQVKRRENWETLRDLGTSLEEDLRHNKKKSYTVHRSI